MEWRERCAFLAHESSRLGKPRGKIRVVHLGHSDGAIAAGGVQKFIAAQVYADVRVFAATGVEKHQVAAF